MKSPFTGGEVILCHEIRQGTFRKDVFTYTHRYYQCVDTGETFTTTKLDTANTSQIYNQYRVTNGIPFPDEIKSVRVKYHLSASKMSRVLGFGENTYRLYENGEMPSIAHGKTLKAIQSVEVLKKYLEDAHDELTENEYRNAMTEICTNENNWERQLSQVMIFRNSNIGIYNGYTQQRVSRLKNVILYFIEHLGDVFVTKMNKLLFYTDFVAYRNLGQGITGLSYQAIQYGPVPVNWDIVYGMIDDIKQDIVDFGNGNSGQKLTSDLSCDMSSLTDGQIEVLELVCRTFAKDTAGRISQKSHDETAWINHVGTHQLIDFNEAFSLKAI